MSPLPVKVHDQVGELAMGFVHSHNATIELHNVRALFTSNIDRINRAPQISNPDWTKCEDLAAQGFPQLRRLWSLNSFPTVLNEPLGN